MVHPSWPLVSRRAKILLWPALVRGVTNQQSGTVNRRERDIQTMAKLGEGRSILLSSRNRTMKIVHLHSATVSVVLSDRKDVK